MQLIDGTGVAAVPGDVAIRDALIVRVSDDLAGWTADNEIDGEGKALAPGFIDSHTHDDLYAIRCPEMLPKLSQGVTTVIGGNCGMSAAPVPPDVSLTPPLNLLGAPGEFRYPNFRDYVAAVCDSRPAVNVAALVGHISLRNHAMQRLDRAATSQEIAAMRDQLEHSLEHGALGLSTGLAYSAANAATTEEVLALARALTEPGMIYATHIRTESDGVLDALKEAIYLGERAGVPVVVSHLKSVGVQNWKRSTELLSLLASQPENSIGWDAYPYSASSTILDLKQIDERIEILITWSAPHPEMSGKTLFDVASAWGISQLDAARRLQPGGAIYHCMSEEDVRAVLAHPRTMIGSDGLPNDAFPHPRLWGTFTRVLGRYAREQKLFPIEEAVRKMTSLPAQRFGLKNRGLIREGFAADLVMFDRKAIGDCASFKEPIQASAGIESVWVSGILSYRKNQLTGERAGTFLSRRA